MTKSTTQFIGAILLITFLALNILFVGAGMADSHSIDAPFGDEGQTGTDTTLDGTTVVEEKVAAIQQAKARKEIETLGECEMKADVSPDDIEALIGKPAAGDKDEAQLICLWSSVRLIQRWIFFGAGVIALTLLAIGGIMWMIGGRSDDPKAIDKAKKLIFASIIGFIIVLLSQGILGIVRSVLGT